MVGEKVVCLPSLQDEEQEERVAQVEVRQILCGQILRLMGDDMECVRCGECLRVIGDDLDFMYILARRLADCDNLGNISQATGMTG